MIGVHAHIQDGGIARLMAEYGITGTTVFNWARIMPMQRLI
jgi:hypothetical protein